MKNEEVFQESVRSMRNQTCVQIVPETTGQMTRRTD